MLNREEALAELDAYYQEEVEAMINWGLNGAEKIDAREEPHMHQLQRKESISESK